MYFPRPLRSLFTPRADQAFELSLCLTIGSAHLALLLTGEISPAHAPPMLATLIGGFAFAGPLKRIPGYAWNTLLIIILVVSLATALAPPRDFESVFRGLSYFLIYVLGVRYLTRRGTGDDLLILLMALLEMCAASIMTISPLYLLSLALFAGCITASLMLHTVRGEVMRLAEGGDKIGFVRHASSTNVPPSFLGFALSSAAAVLVLGLVVFFSIPRLGRSLFAWQTGIHSRVTGFSDSVELGEVGRIIQSGSLVMRVKIEKGTVDRRSLYLKGNALGYYDGRRWSDKAGYKNIHYYRYTGTATLSKMTSLAASVKQEIILEPIDSSVLFGIPRIASISPPFRYRAVVEYWNDYVGFPISSPIYDRVSYVVWSEPPPTDFETCREAWRDAAPLPERVSRHYLQVPDGMGKVTDLARETVGQATSPCDKARLIRDYLAANYEYSLDTEANRAADPISDFLFESRRGYCEHFATAMTLMLRGVGVPCRIAAGYMGGQYNPIEEYYLVRENMAHTWVEMYLPDGRWMLLDPTPAGRLQEEGEGWLNWLGYVFDSLRYRWDRWVVDLTLQDQIHLASTARHRGMMAGRMLMRFPKEVLDLATTALRGWPALGLLLLAVIFYLIWSRYARPRSREAGSDDLALVKSYRELLEQLETKGFKRKPSETHLEFAGRLETMALPYSGAFSAATRAYLRVRFGRLHEEDIAGSSIKQAMSALRSRPSVRT